MSNQSVEIIPYKLIVDADDQVILGRQLHELVNLPKTQDHLKIRHLLGVLHRHADIGGSYVSVVRGYGMHQSGKLGVFVLRQDGQVVGSATVDPNAELKRQKRRHLPLLDKYVGGLLTDGVYVPGPQVTAWVAPDVTHSAHEVLLKAYKSLSDPQGLGADYFKKYGSDDSSMRPRAWALEPVIEPGNFMIHEAIEDAGFDRAAISAFYDVGESRRVRPPKSDLYIAHSM